MLKFTFDNEYSWMREKNISYRVTVTPPSSATLAAGRRRRAKACQKAVDEDLESATQRLGTASTQKKALEADIAELTKSLAEKKTRFEDVSKEESWLKTRVELRTQQAKLLKQRLDKGWKDEKGIKM